MYVAKISIDMEPPDEMIYSYKNVQPDAVFLVVC